jgi:hypothetical protein
MSFSSVTILNQKLGELPEDMREKAAQLLADHLEDIRDELRWDESFKRTSSKLSEMAGEAKKEIKEGRAEEMDFEKL